MNEQSFKVGDKIKIVELPPYLKTAEPMPMLRPADLINTGDEGIIISINPSNYWGIRFKQGAFLLESKYFNLIE